MKNMKCCEYSPRGAVYETCNNDLTNILKARMHQVQTGHLKCHDPFWDAAPIPNL